MAPDRYCVKHNYIVADLGRVLDLGRVGSAVLCLCRSGEISVSDRFLKGSKIK